MKRAMSTVKNIAAAAMTLAVFFGFAGFKPVTVPETLEDFCAEGPNRLP